MERSVPLTTTLELDAGPADEKKRGRSKIYNLLLNIPLGETLKKIIPFYWPPPSTILDVTAGRKLAWSRFLGINNGETLSPRKVKGYDVHFMDISPQAPDIVQAHAWELPYPDNSVDTVFCDFPFTPSLMDDRLSDPRLAAHYSRDPRVFYQEGPADMLMGDTTQRKGGRSSMSLMRDGGRKKMTTNENLYMGELQADTSKYWESPNPRLKGGSTLVEKQRQKELRADTYVRNAAPINRYSTNPIDRWKRTNRKKGSHLANQFVRPYINFQNTWREFNRVARDGLIVKIGEYHNDWQYYPGDFEAALFYDHRLNKKSDFHWVARIFYKGVRPMVHQVPHAQPIITFYMVFKKDIRGMGIKPRRSKVRTPMPRT